MNSDEEYQRSSLKVEVLMNLIYLGLFNDVDKERVMEKVYSNTKIQIHKHFIY